MNPGRCVWSRGELTWWDGGKPRHRRRSQLCRWDFAQPIFAQPREQMHPELSMSHCVPVSSGAAAVCAELCLPSKTPNKKLADFFAGGKCPPCCCRGGIPHGLGFGWLAAASPTLPQSPTSQNCHNSLSVEDDSIFPSTCSVSRTVRRCVSVYHPRAIPCLPAAFKAARCSREPGALRGCSSCPSGSHLSHAGGLIQPTAPSLQSSGGGTAPSSWLTPTHPPLPYAESPDFL